MNRNITLPFNNAVETSLRIIVLLYRSYPSNLDMNKILYLDFLNVHYSDTDNIIEPIHPKSQNIDWEIFVRRDAIQEGLDLLFRKWLIEKLYLDEWVYYKISDHGVPFIDSLDSNYSGRLIENSKKIIDMFWDKEISFLDKVIKQIQH